MDSNIIESDKAYYDKPSPDKLDEFLPWACKELGVTEKIQVIHTIQTEFTSPAATKKYPKIDKANQVSSRKLSGSLQRTQMSSSQEIVVPDRNILKITTVYDTNNNLVHLKFDKKTTIDRMLFKIILLIMPYHLHLTGITFKNGMDYGIVHELNHLLAHPITEVCLDDTRLPDGHYEVLLENQTQLKNLSLARCNIDDHAAKRIASKLFHSLAASKTLLTLNLATNRITDEGAKAIAEALRSNRCLLYLNLSDNRIMDDGCVAILTSLGEFILTDDEILETRFSYLITLKKELPSQQVKIEEEKRVPSKKKIPKIQPAITPGKKTKPDKPMFIKESYNFVHPFSRKNTRNIDSDICCYGNNQLAYLNIAYNNLTVFSMNKLLQVLKYQKASERKPRGLINVVIEGNFIPKTCSVVDEIDCILIEFLDECCKTAKIKKKPRNNSNI